MSRSQLDRQYGGFEAFCDKKAIWLDRGAESTVASTTGYEAQYENLEEIKTNLCRKLGYVRVPSDCSRR